MIRIAVSRHHDTKTPGTRADGSTLRVVVISALAVAVPRAALACPVCFGNSDAPMAIATNTGIFFMLGVVAVMLTAFASFFVYLIRRANRMSPDTAPAHAQAGGLEPSEGTAQ